MSRSPLVRRSLAASAAATLLCLSGLPAHGSEGDPHGLGLTDLSAAADLPAAAEEALEQAGATHGGPPSTPGAGGPATPAVPSGEPGTPATPATPAVPPVPDTPAEPPTPPTPPTPDPQGDEPEKDEKPAPAPGQDQDDEKGPDKGKGKGKGGDQGTGQPSPPGNNGTVKIAAPGDEAGHPSNNPHPGCEVVVEWFGYDAIEGLASTVTFTPLAPTADAAISGTDPATVNLDNDPAGGGTDLDGEQAYTLIFDGVPHPQQGYHVKLTVETPYSNGSDRKSKVFWVEPCEDTDQPPTETPGVPPVVDTPGVPPVVDTPDGPPTETPGVPPVVTPPVGGPPPVLPPAPPLTPPLTPPSAELPVDAPPVDVPPAGGPKTEGPTPGNGVLGVDLPAAGPSGPTAARAGSGTGAAVPIAVAAGAPPAAGAASDPGSGPLALVVLGLALAVSARLRRAVGAR